MARITKSSLTLCALLFTLPYSQLSLASPHASSAATHKAHTSKAKHTTSKHKESSSSKQHASAKKKSTATRTAAKSRTERRTVKSDLVARSKRYTKLGQSMRNDEMDQFITRLAGSGESGSLMRKCITRKGYKKPSCIKVHTRGNSAGFDAGDSIDTYDLADTPINNIPKGRVLSAQQTAMNKLMNQLGKPYRWGGATPKTGFDCSGLIYYAYKDLVNFRLPRTANEMYHLRDAAPINKGELVSGDLVFFRTHSHRAADHVGVYVGNGKFIQSPRTGRDIVITSLSDDYWQRHYVGARRVMTADNIR
ncbi:NlpC/P60 family protein [Shimwellia pseudoproteus]|nr:NlpC/P60 family protein [Shimwellia pseudoproteus]